jgi:hypothetical protein
MLYQKCFLQIEFKHRQQCTRFHKVISKDKAMSKYIDCKIGSLIMLKFDTKEIKDGVCSAILKNVTGAEISKRESFDGKYEGFEYIFIK